MEKFKRIIQTNRPFFMGAAILLALGVVFLILNTHANGFLVLNPVHNDLLNTFFIYFTNLGDGIFALAVVGYLLLRRKYRFGWQVLISFLVSGFVAQLVKRFVFSPRPKDFFGERNQIIILKDITLGGGASFPSGHTVTAFALATSLALFSKNKSMAWLWLVLAAGIGYSRIYLSQHFPRDVFAGAIIGMLIALTVYYFIEPNPAYDS